MWKNAIDDKLRNNLHNQSRLISISRTNIVTTLYYINSLEYHKKIAYYKFLETFYQRTNKEK